MRREGNPKKRTGKLCEEMTLTECQNRYAAQGQKKAKIATGDWNPEKSSTHFQGWCVEQYSVQILSRCCLINEWSYPNLVPDTLDRGTSGRQTGCLNIHRNMYQVDVKMQFLWLNLCRGIKNFEPSIPKIKFGHQNLIVTWMNGAADTSIHNKTLTILIHVTWFVLTSILSYLSSQAMPAAAQDMLTIV